MRRFISLVLVLAFVCSGLVLIPHEASAESMYIRKVVSVVYDDSGSMKEGDKWAYANYAMQAFCGMLNSEDQLYITYMSEAEKNKNLDPAKVNLSSGGIQTSVDAVRNRPKGYGTPWNAVQVAYNKLLRVQDDNPNTQYWLVVITDGDFDVFEQMSEVQKQQFLDDKFSGFANGMMPNGTHPKITYLAIGKKIFAPKENKDLGITPYRANTDAEITTKMGEMADQVSGRTRLTGNDLKKIDDKTVEVSSDIPLLNIAVIANASNAKVTSATHNGETSVAVTRKAILGFPGYASLNGSAFLLGKENGGAIGDGTYRIAFDQPIDLNNVVILYEPALEVRMTVTVNGTEVTDYTELTKTKSRDKVKISCKLYEMDTDKEIPPSLLPASTKYHLAILEEGNVVKESTGKTMELEEHELSHLPTQLRGEVIIPGFSPIVYSVEFTPVEYVEYAITAEYGNDIKSVKFDDIATNTDLSVLFRITANGEPMTDPEAVKALGATVNASPAGNTGTVEYASDGAIVFTPNQASVTSTAQSGFDVDVVCALPDGTSATATYSVLLANYTVSGGSADGVAKKHRLAENEAGVSFTFQKDGVQLSKADVENGITVAFDEEHKDFLSEVSVADDGTITIVPKMAEGYRMNPWSWLWYWKYYFFDIPDGDVTVTLNHALGTSTGVLAVENAPIGFMLLNVWLPIALELFLLLLLANYLYCVFRKPRFAKGAKLYVGTLRYDSGNEIHILRDFGAVSLERFNRISIRKNGRLKFKLKADVVNAGGIKIRADYSGRVICEEYFPWYRGVVVPHDYDLAHLDTPTELEEYFNNPGRRLEIEEFAPTDTIEDNGDRTLYSAGQRKPKFFVVADGPLALIGGHNVIQTGRIFIYKN